MGEPDSKLGHPLCDLDVTLTRRADRVSLCQPRNDGGWSPALGSKRLPPLISLAYFEAAARTGSFAAAAKEQHVTPAAISQQIKSLEDLLGVELFVRQHRKVSLTAEAKQALPTLQEGFAAIYAAVDSLRTLGEDRGIITVCAEPLFATKWLVPRLHRFYAKSPEAEVRLQASVNSIDTCRDGPVSEATFRRAGVDLSVRFGYGAYPDLASDRLLEVALSPVCTPELAAQIEVPSDLLRMNLLSDSTSFRSPERFGWTEWLLLAGVSVNRRLREQRFGNGLLSLEAALTGQGVLLTSPHLIQSELKDRKLVTPFAVVLPCAFGYHAVCTHAGLERPIVRQFRDWLFEEVDLERFPPK